MVPLIIHIANFLPLSRAVWFAGMGVTPCGKSEVNRFARLYAIPPVLGTDRGCIFAVALVFACRRVLDVHLSKDTRLSIERQAIATVFGAPDEVGLHTVEGNFRRK